MDLPFAEFNSLRLGPPRFDLSTIRTLREDLVLPRRPTFEGQFTTLMPIG